MQYFAMFCRVVVVVDSDCSLENLKKSGYLKVVRENGKIWGKCVLACSVLACVLWWTQNK